MERNVAALRSRQHDRSVEQRVHEVGEHGNANLHASRAHIVPHLAQEVIIPDQVQNGIHELFIFESIRDLLVPDICLGTSFVFDTKSKGRTVTIEDADGVIVLRIPEPRQVVLRTDLCGRYPPGQNARQLPAPKSP